MKARKNRSSILLSTEVDKYYSFQDYINLVFHQKGTTKQTFILPSIKIKKHKINFKSKTKNFNLNKRFISLDI